MNRGEGWEPCPGAAISFQGIARGAMAEEQPDAETESAASEPKPNPVKSALGRLSSAACLRIDADTAQMMAAYTPIMERARDLKAQIVTFCEMVADQYDVHARECLEVACPVEEFELALWRTSRRRFTSNSNTRNGPPANA